MESEIGTVRKTKRDGEREKNEEKARERFYFEGFTSTAAASFFQCMVSMRGFRQKKGPDETRTSDRRPLQVQ